MLNEHERKRERQRAPSQLMEATILDPPTDADGWLRVEIDNRPGAAETCPWQHEPEADPEPGDAAWVMESDGGNFVVVLWWPQSGGA
jgi:hypothetical protein